MKKIYLTLGLGAFILGANAQQKLVKSYTENHLSQAVILNDNSLAKTAATGTLTPPTFNPGGCATNTANIVYYSTAQYTATPTYTVDARGFMFGTNVNYQTQAGVTYTIESNEAAQKYNITGTANVTDIIVFVAIAKSDAATSQVMASVYSENALTKAPLTQIGASTMQALNLMVQGSNVLHFATPISLTSGNFFAAIKAPSMGGSQHDTLAILSTKVGCSTTDSLSWRQTTVAGFGSQWSSIKSDFSINVDAMIFPVVDITTGLNNSISKGNLTLLAAFPNPATNELSINFGLNQTSKVEIEIYDVTGKIVNTIKLDNLEAGNHSSKISVSNLNAGVYMYSVKSENAKMFSKFTVAK